MRVVANKYYVCDNLDLVRSIPDESVDLVYIDPPFGSLKNYYKKSDDNIEISYTDKEFSKSLDSDVSSLFDASPLVSFLTYIEKDNSILGSYLFMMFSRLLEIHRVLKPTGSVYVQCDYSSCHYLKIILDYVFGNKNYINDVIIKRPTSHNDARKHFGRIHDNLLLFVKDKDNYTWNKFYEPYSEEDLKKFKQDINGRFFRESSLMVTNVNNKSNNKFSWFGYSPKDRQEWAYSRDKLDSLQEQGLISWNSRGTPSLKRYLDELNGKLLQDVWTSGIYLTKGESVYPTQKSMNLLRRIISISSNPGDLVLDLFAGSGTTFLAAKEGNRNFLGADISQDAFEIFKNRYEVMFEEKYE